ncbi:MAG TPA: cytochrome c3 family protein [Anaeromyxobacteraceae bacterium]
MSAVRQLAIALVMIAPTAVYAAGGHDAVGCGGCHSLHAAKGEVIYAVPVNTKYLNPKTKQPYAGSTAFCLACHQDTDKGGQGFAPVSQHSSHPFGISTVNAKVAKVPPELLRDGRFECIGCHDPHPSNPNYKYLRVDTKGGKEMDAFCAVCHSMKAEASAAQKVTFFTSMDERTERAARATPAVAAEPKKKK